MKGVMLNSYKNIMQQPEHYVKFLQKHDVTIWTTKHCHITLLQPTQQNKQDN